MFHRGHYRILLVEVEDRSLEVLAMQLPENKRLNIAEIFEQKPNFLNRG